MVFKTVLTESHFDRLNYIAVDDLELLVPLPPLSGAGFTGKYHQICFIWH